MLRCFDEGLPDSEPPDQAQTAGPGTSQGAWFAHQVEDRFVTVVLAFLLVPFLVLLTVCSATGVDGATNWPVLRANCR